MRRLLQISFTVMALVASASVSSAADCSSDPNECTLKKLCEVATALDGSNTIWSTDAGSTKHVTVAQSLGMECGVIPIVDLCETDPSECKVSEICEKATTVSVGQISWDDTAAGHVALAKEYGLSCDVKAAGVSDDLLCSKATYTNTTLKVSWALATSYAAVREAKARGLSCGVAEVNITNFKKAFTSQTRLRRRQLQYALKKLDYYSYGVDGLWGRGTSSGFDKFVSAYGLKSKSESQVFSSLLSKVDVPSSFAAPEKKANSNNTSGLTAIISNPSMPADQAYAVCKPQAILAGRNAQRSSRSRGGSFNCVKIGFMTDCTRGSGSGGFKGGAATALVGIMDRNRARDAVMASCLAQFGWRR